MSFQIPDPFDGRAQITSRFHDYRGAGQIHGGLDWGCGQLQNKAIRFIQGRIARWQRNDPLNGNAIWIQTPDNQALIGYAHLAQVPAGIQAGQCSLTLPAIDASNTGRVSYGAQCTLHMSLRFWDPIAGAWAPLTDPEPYIAEPGTVPLATIGGRLNPAEMDTLWLVLLAGLMFLQWRNK